VAAHLSRELRRTIFRDLASRDCGFCAKCPGDGLPVVTEVMDARQIEQVAEHADMLQIGSRNMQNYTLLVEAGRSGKPVLLKRGMAANLCEWLGAAEYLAKEGNFNIVLCERGIKAYPSGEYSRYVLDLNVIPAVKEHTFLPVIVDPSHARVCPPWSSRPAAQRWEFGCHGLIIEVASDRLDAPKPKCDAAQAIGRRHWQGLSNSRLRTASSR